MKRARILLADDHSLILTGIRTLLAGNFDIVAEVEDGRTLVEETLRLRPDLVILDVAMPLLNGIEATRQIVRRVPKCRVLILSMHSDEAYITRAIQAGAKGFLLKDAAGQDLVRAVAAVADNKAFFSHVVAQSMLDDYIRRVATDTVVDPYESLSEREREIFQLIAEGHSNKDIALILSISPATVETHRAHLLQKLRLHNTVEVVRYATRRGIIQ